MSTLLAAAAVAVAAAPSSGSAASTPPNVLFVVGDDVGYSDFGFFNDGKVLYSVRVLAREGGARRLAGNMQRD